MATQFFVLALDGIERPGYELVFGCGGTERRDGLAEQSALGTGGLAVPLQGAKMAGVVARDARGLMIVSGPLLHRIDA